MLMHKKYVLRTGGDFLWESYVERTGDLVLFKDFYSTRMEKLSRKEKLVFSLGGKALRYARTVVFSTQWQQNIFTKVYRLDPKKQSIVENFCHPRETFAEPEGRFFVAGTRHLKWKNAELLKEAFAEAQIEIQKKGLEPIELDCGKAVYDSFVEKIRHAYAVILVSIGDISPNMIYDAIGTGTPFVVTTETGITNRIKDAAVFVDPLNKKDIVDKIVWIADPKNRAIQAKKVQAISFVHTWEQIGDELIKVSHK